MDKILIKGGNKLHGMMKISGSKNSSLAIIAASLLCDEEINLIDVPNVRDVTFMLNLIGNLGGKIQLNGLDINEYGSNICSINISNKSVNSYVANYDFVKKMRASVLVLAPLIARFEKAHVSLPGGCAIGIRPINLHLLALEKMGAKIELNSGYIDASINGRFRGAEIEFPFNSVGATETTICAAVLAEGKTCIKNAATEPEIFYLSEFLNSMGAKISGHGTSYIEIIGVEKFHKTSFKIPEDRIEAATYAIAAACTDGDVLLQNCNLKTFEATKNEFEIIGIGIEEKPNGIRCFKSKEFFHPYNIVTDTYPNFPTDIQAQIMVPLLFANGESTISEKIFENRFMHVAELVRMGANIEIEHDMAKIYKIENLSGTTVMATDLRASFSLIIAGLIAENETLIDRVYHLNRGYENVVSKLTMCGANIKITS